MAIGSRNDVKNIVVTNKNVKLSSSVMIGQILRRKNIKYACFSIIFWSNGRFVGSRVICCVFNESLYVRNLEITILREL